MTPTKAKAPESAFLSLNILLLMTLTLTFDPEVNVTKTDETLGDTTSCVRF